MSEMVIYLLFYIIKKNQSTYKPGSVVTYRVCTVCHLSAPAVTDRLYRSTLQRLLSKEKSNEQLSYVGIHELSTSDAHSPHVTTWLVSSYLTFSPLPYMT